MWIVEVRVKVKSHEVAEWYAIRPTNGSRYEWETRAEADSARRMCYPDQTDDEVRVREVKE